MPTKCSCKTVGQILRVARGILNDDVRACGEAAPDHTHWSTAQLIDYVNEAVSMLVSMRPDAFTVVEPITLQPGPYQTAPEGYDAFVSLVWNTDASGNATSAITQSSDVSLHVPSVGSSCEDCGAADGARYTVSSFSRFPQSVRDFTVQPPVPSTGAVAIARMVKEPLCVTSLNDCVPTPPKFTAAITNWVLHRAMSKDVDSPAFSALAVRYGDGFFGLLESMRVAESRFRSGFHLGAVGDGDGQLRNR